MKEDGLFLIQGDCLERMKELDENSIDAVVTDPPYGLAFMGKKWDYSVPGVEVWRECLRVLKPGGYLLAFAGTRTQHRMCVNIEDAGFEIRDMIAWVYGSGFPKSHNLRDEWEGWGTALKPALEPITVARKPFAGTIAENVLTWGTGAINVDGCRIELDLEAQKNINCIQRTNKGKGHLHHSSDRNAKRQTLENPIQTYKTNGRWPANLIHDGSDEVVDVFPDESARFFYCPKADKNDRDAGLDREESTPGQKTNRKEGSAGITPYTGTRVPTKNNHPTVKPLDLMRYLCRLVTQPGGVVLDPFMGSGTTGRACLSEGFGFVGIERDPDYFELCKQRMNRVQLPLFGGA